MSLHGIDVSKCQRSEKVVSEGLCLSFDLLKGLCLETMEPCLGRVEDSVDEEDG